MTKKSAEFIKYSQKCEFSGRFVYLKLFQVFKMHLKLFKVLNDLKSFQMREETKKFLEKEPKSKRFFNRKISSTRENDTKSFYIYERHEF